VILLLQYAPRGIVPVLFRGSRRTVRDRGQALPARVMPSRGGLVLEAASLEKRFGGLVAARSIGLAVHAGEIVALIGPNGAGKSTTFNLISGALSPDAGSIRLLGHAVHGARVVARQGLARTFQHVKLLPEASVLD